MSKKEKKTSTLVLLSGGLDSILAAKLLMEQGIEVEGICFYSNFFGCNLAEKAAKQLGIKLRESDIGEEFLKFLKKKPKHGYGVGLNPCIDCHVLMFKKAGEIMRQEKFAFVATGEVLNERPMSQHRQALKMIEKEAGLEGYLLRPLSAKLLEPTILENAGLVGREKLLDISGRSRKKQMELAIKFNIIDYPTPAGGCMLTQEGFVGRLKELIEYKPAFSVDDVELVKIGRHFWFDSVWIVLGRNKEENEKLLKAKAENDMIIEPDGFIGPTALVRGSTDSEVIRKANELIIKYSPKARDKDVNELNFKKI
jgi:tRNA U34 2-thiouridine synthase MnmA/TrmU